MKLCQQPVIFSVVKSITGRGVTRTGRAYIDKKYLVLLHPLSNIEITNYFNYKPRFNGVFSRNNLPRVKDVAYVLNLNDKKGEGTHWVFIIYWQKIQLYTLIILEFNIFL